jgi:hypothetical protein
LFALAGCTRNGVLAPIDRVFGHTDDGSTVFGSAPMTRSDDSNPIDLPNLISGVRVAVCDPRDASQNKCPTETASQHDNDQYEERMRIAYDTFDRRLSDDDKRTRRTHVQEALFAKSVALCNAYKKQLLQASTEQNLIMGDASTLLAGLGSIFSKAATVRPLAAGSAISSGFRSEYNSDVFQTLNIQVITAGIEKRRSEWYAAVLKTRSCSIKDYTLNQAIKDAFYYHASCSLYAGLEEASLSIHQAQRPGLDEIGATLAKLKGLQSAIKSLSSDNNNGNTDTVSNGASPTAVAVNGCEIPVQGTPKASVKPDSGVTGVEISYTVKGNETADTLANALQTAMSGDTSVKTLKIKVGAVSNAAFTVSNAKGVTWKSSVDPATEGGTAGETVTTKSTADGASFTFAVATIAKDDVIHVTGTPGHSGGGAAPPAALALTQNSKDVTKDGLSLAPGSSAEVTISGGNPDYSAKVTDSGNAPTKDITPKLDKTKLTLAASAEAKGTYTLTVSDSTADKPESATAKITVKPKAPVLMEGRSAAPNPLRLVVGESGATLTLKGGAAIAGAKITGPGAGTEEAKLVTVTEVDGNLKVAANAGAAAGSYLLTVTDKNSAKATLKITVAAPEGDGKAK